MAVWREALVLTWYLPFNQTLKWEHLKLSPVLFLTKFLEFIVFQTSFLYFFFPQSFSGLTEATVKLYFRMLRSSDSEQRKGPDTFSNSNVTVVLLKT